MIKKESLFNIQQDLNHNKPIFLLAWGQFLTYEELEKYQYLEVYDAFVYTHKIKSPEEWDKQVIPYTAENLKKALCVCLTQSINYINTHSKKDTLFDMNDMYFDDVKAWLKLLEDDRFNKYKSDDTNAIKKFYQDISKIYNFGL